MNDLYILGQMELGTRKNIVTVELPLHSLEDELPLHFLTVKLHLQCVPLEPEVSDNVFVTTLMLAAATKTF